MRYKKLSIESQERILESLTIKSRISFALTCKLFYAQLAENKIWKNKYNVRDYQQFSEKMKSLHKETQMKIIYGLLGDIHLNANKIILKDKVASQINDKFTHTSQPSANLSRSYGYNNTFQSLLVLNGVISPNHFNKLPNRQRNNLSLLGVVILITQGQLTLEDAKNLTAQEAQALHEKKLNIAPNHTTKNNQRILSDKSNLPKSSKKVQGRSTRDKKSITLPENAPPASTQPPNELKIRSLIRKIRPRFIKPIDTHLNKLEDRTPKPSCNG